MIRWMRGLLKFLFVLLVIGMVGLCGAWLWAGRMEGPRIEIRNPEKFVGQSTALEMMVQAPNGQFSVIEATLEQNGKTHRIYPRDESEQAGVNQQTAEQL